MDAASILDFLFKAGGILVLAGLAWGMWLAVVHAANRPDSDDETARRKKNPGDWEL